MLENELMESCWQITLNKKKKLHNGELLVQEVNYQIVVDNSYRKKQHTIFKYLRVRSG